MFKYLTGAAALALAASAALADPGGGHGGGGGGHGGGDADGGGNPHAEKGGGRERDNGGGEGQAEQRGGGGFEKHAMQGHGGGQGQSGENGAHGSDRSAKADRQFEKANKAVQNGREDRGDRRDASAEHRDDIGRRDNVGDFGAGDRTSSWRWASSIPQRSRGLIAGCPPGLAKKNNGCLPPGLARGGAARVFYDSPSWWNFDNRWHDAGDFNGGDFHYYDGYLVRSGTNGLGGGIGSWLPLLGGALAPGNQWPSQYASSQLPPYYQDYYGLGSTDGYRYYDDTLYRVDPQSQVITAITALLTGNTFQVGQRMPAGYDVYNVPYSYRDQYADGPNSNYRYNDGAIYRVDPTTQLVQAVIELLT